MKLKLISFLTLITLSTTAYSLENFKGKVTFLEATYLPSVVVFSMDVGNSTCPAGTILTWTKANNENNKAAYSTLMTALVSGKKIDFYINDGDTGCYGQFLHLLSN